MAYRKRFLISLTIVFTVKLFGAQPQKVVPTEHKHQTVQSSSTPSKNFNAAYDRGLHAQMAEQALGDLIILEAAILSKKKHDPNFESQCEKVVINLHAFAFAHDVLNNRFYKKLGACGGDMNVYAAQLNARVRKRLSAAIVKN